MDEFRSWHEEVVKRLYDNDKELQKELRLAREKFLAGVAPR